MNRQEVMIELGISKSEFYRQHNAGIAAVVDWLERIEVSAQPWPPSWSAGSKKKANLTCARILEACGEREQGMIEATYTLLME